MTVTWLDLDRTVAVMAWHRYSILLVAIRVTNEVALLMQVMIFLGL